MGKEFPGVTGLEENEIIWKFVSLIQEQIAMGKDQHQSTDP